MQIENPKLLAENKLILLYILSQHEEEMRNTDLTHFIVENDYMNYFLTQHYISELINTGNVLLLSKMAEPYYKITEKGLKTLLYFKKRIPKNIRENIDCQFKSIKKKKEKERQIVSNYYETSDNEYVVDLKALENNKIIFTLSLNLPNKEQAKEICSKWRENSSELYKSLLYLFVESKE